MLKKIIISGTVICFVQICMFITVARASNTWYVDVSRPNDDGPGDSPETAWQIIQSALDNPNLSDGDTILVAPGIYDQGGFRASAAQAIDRVYFTKNNITLQAISTNPADTVIMGRPDPDTVNGFGTNAVRGAYVRLGGRMVGFTISNGHSSTGNSGRGGGVLLFSDSVVSNCVIVGNRAERGAGISPPRSRDGGTIYNSIIKNNFVPGGNGAGISSEGGNDPIIVVNSIIRNNTNHHPTASGSACSFGGGASGSVLINCRIEGNVASSTEANGRPYASATSECLLINCIVVGNIIPNGNSIGGAVYNGITINSTIAGNIDHNNLSAVGGYSPVVYNSIIWGNYRGGVYNINMPSVPGNIEYSCAPELDHGVNGNITNNPVFMDEPGLNLRLTGPARASPAINAGNNTFILDLLNDHPEAAFDRDGNPRILEDIVDMGAYEYQPPPVGSMLRFF